MIRKHISIYADCLLYILIAVMSFSQAYFGGDEAAKYLEPMVKFWVNYSIGSIAVGAAAMKAFRSTKYAENQKQKEEEHRSMDNSQPK